MQGVENFLKNDVDGELWLAAVQMYAVDTPEFYPAHFGNEVDEYLRCTYGISEITLDNAASVYQHIKNDIQIVL